MFFAICLYCESSWPNQLGREFAVMINLCSVEHPGFDPRRGSSQCYIFLALGCSFPRSCGDCVHFGAYIQCSGVGFDVLSSDVKQLRECLYSR